MKTLDNNLFNIVEKEAKVSSRRRMNYDLRSQAMDSDRSWKDISQRMLNVMMKGRMVLSSLRQKTGRMGKMWEYLVKT